MKCRKKASKPETSVPVEPGDDSEIYFQEVEPEKSSALKFSVAVQPAVENSNLDGQSDSTSVEELSERLEEVLEHLEGISRTMKMVRWVMWSIGFATLLSIVITVAGLAFSMSMIGSLGQLFQGPDRVAPADAAKAAGAQQGDGVGIMPQLQSVLKVIEDQAKLRDELRKEIGQ